jgi:hypothetical protein
VRIALAVVWTLVLVLTGFGVGRAFDGEETTLTVHVSSADHELEEGYFSLGETATVMAKPGTELFRFLSRHRGRKVKILLQESPAAELSRLHR